jgi:hypothetical protein
MAGPVPAIHVFLAESTKDVDARHKAGHDEEKSGYPNRNSLYPFAATSSQRAR